jgi:two-component system, cell cycle response regulator
MHAAVVDPSRVVLKLVSQLLTQRGDRVSAFQDPNAALHKIQTDPTVDVLITSLELQPIGGLELCWEARTAISPQRALCIIVMSSLTDDAKLAEVLDSGADDLISKPVNRLELHARLRLASRLKAAQLHLVRLAETDPLTGLYNRRAFFRQLSNLIARPERAICVSAVLLDIDHFKAVNDTYGHDVGDVVIKAVGGEAARVTKLVGRLGGEEYALILEDCPENRAMALGDNLRKRCAGIPFRAGEQYFSVTCSLGVSRWTPGDTADDLLKKADIALYQAKAEGRNRVRAAHMGSDG